MEFYENKVKGIAPMQKKKKRKKNEIPLFYVQHNR